MRRACVANQREMIFRAGNRVRSCVLERAISNVCAFLTDGDGCPGSESHRVVCGKGYDFTSENPIDASAESGRCCILNAVDDFEVPVREREGSARRVAHCRRCHTL